jgi:predicted phosphodiesterase
MGKTGIYTTEKRIAHCLSRQGLGVPSDYLKLPRKLPRKGERTDDAPVATSKPRSSDVLVSMVAPSQTEDFTERILIVPDTHVPFHDERAFQVMLAGAAVFKPTTIVILGDFVDFYSVSFHSKNPSRKTSLMDEVAAARSQLAKLDQLGAIRKVYISGNHEYRLERYLAEKAPELAECVDVQSLLQLNENGWEWVPYRSHIQIGKLFFTHDTGAAGRDAHVRAGATFEHSVAIGHTHRVATHYFGNAAGESHVAAMLGWLGDRSQIDYMNPIKVFKDWQLGFGVAFVEPTGVTHLSAIPIIDYKAVVCGQLVSA